MKASCGDQETVYCTLFRTLADISVILFLRLHMSERRVTSHQRAEFIVVKNPALVSTWQ